MRNLLDILLLVCCIINYDINTWISQATDGLIENMLDYISDDTVMYLINTVLFDAERAQINKEGSTHSGNFTSVPNYEHTVILNRPFVYAIIDNATDLPIFIGTFLSVQ